MPAGKRPSGGHQGGGLPEELRRTQSQDRQRSGLAVTEEWRPGRRRATWLPEEEQATQSDELHGETVSRYGHLRSAPVVALVYARSGTTPRRASLLDSTRFGASSMAYRLSATKVTVCCRRRLTQQEAVPTVPELRERCSIVERLLLATCLVQAQEKCPEDRESLVAFGLGRCATLFYRVARCVPTCTRQQE